MRRPGHRRASPRTWRGRPLAVAPSRAASAGCAAHPVESDGERLCRDPGPLRPRGPGIGALGIRGSADRCGSWRHPRCHARAPGGTVARQRNSHRGDRGGHGRRHARPGCDPAAGPSRRPADGHRFGGVRLQRRICVPQPVRGP